MGLRITLLFCLLSVGMLHAQTDRTLLATGGGSVVTGGHTVTFSVGETVSGLQLGGDRFAPTYLLQGFQQPGGKGGALPVEWLAFTAVPAGKSNQLDWSVTLTGQEQSFVIERSADGTAFSPISQRVLPDRLPGEAHFQYLDSTYPERLLFYRIRQTDLDGTISNSPIVNLDRSDHGRGKALLYPNPATTHLNLFLPETWSSSAVQVELYDAVGRLVMYRGALPAGATLSVARLQRGTYVYQIKGEAGMDVGVLIIQ